MAASELELEKAALRLVSREARAQAARNGDGAVVRSLTGVVSGFRPRSVVGGYLAMGSEVDVAPALLAARRTGAQLALPCTGPAGSALVFRAWSPGDALVSEPFGTQAPSDASPILAPDYLIVPLLAFDATGNRLGWGGGFYDRTLARLRGEAGVTAVGVAYAVQEVAAVPAGEHDQPLDMVVTEDRVFRFGKADGE